MTFSRFLTAAAVPALALSALLAGPVAAQTATQPAPTTTTRPAAVPPIQPSTTPATTTQRPAAATTATPGQATRPAAAAGQAQTAPVNLNTATAAQLDTLPQIGQARAQAIITERGKGRFRDWADFERRMAGTTVNHQALNAIKARVIF